MSSEYDTWFDSIDINDPELRVDVSVCACTWEPPMDSAGRKKHFKEFHPYWVSCKICAKTWRYTDVLAWEAKFEGEELRGHDTSYGVDKPSKPVAEPVYSESVEHNLTSNGWTALGNGISARIEVIARMADMEDLSGKIEFRISSFGERVLSPHMGISMEEPLIGITTFRSLALSFNEWCDITPTVQAKRVWTNAIAVRVKS